MPNLRILYDNAANRASSLVASTTAGSLAAANLLTDIKSQVWRSTSTSATLTVQWAVSELIGVVALPFCNLTSTATIRVRGYSDLGSTLVVDTGTVSACAYSSLGMWNWGMLPLGVNGFSYAGGTYGNVWIPPTWCKQLTIDLVDSANTSGYLEASRLVTGGYWESIKNADYGAGITMVDTSVHYRNDAGDLLTDIGTRNRKISLNVSDMPSSDRAQLMDILRGNGLPKPVYLSLFPESDDPALEQTYQVYCKLSSMSAITAPYYNVYSAPLEVEEV